MPDKDKTERTGPREGGSHVVGGDKAVPKPEKTQAPKRKRGEEE